MNQNTSDNPYIDGLWERYKKAVAEEKKQLKVIETARGALGDAKARKDRYAQSLRDEGEQVNAEQPKPKRARPATVFISTKPSQNGHVVPKSDTHAVFLLMRKNHNDPATLEELEELARQEDYSLTLEDINRVVWKQITRKYMQRSQDGRFNQTEDGEKFNSFRQQKAEA